MQAIDNQNLKLESLSKELHINAPKDINVNSYDGAVKIGSLSDMMFSTKNGKVC